MNPFNVGDRVKCVTSGETSLIEGMEYTVKQVLKSGGVWFVRVKEITVFHTYLPNRFILSNFSLENE